MGRIQSSVGLITGVPIQTTVDQLMKLAARPRDLLASRLKTLQEEQVALADLTARVISVQLAGKRLGAADLFSRLKVTSSDPALLTATLTGTPPAGNYSFTPVRRAQNHQMLSSGFVSDQAKLGAGSFTVQFGGFVDKGVRLEHLNGGAGVERGRIRITDRSGASEVIDLRSAMTLDDVLQAINAANQINVTAVADGDSIRLIDHTGQAAANLKVQNVGTTQTATHLGLDTIDTAAGEATGRDVLRLYQQLKIEQLNDGNGISLQKALPDLDVTLRDGSSLSVDFRRLGRAPGYASGTTDAANGTNAAVTVGAKNTGGDYDNITIRFVDDPNVAQGSETVTYDDSDPNNKTLTFHIAAGQTTSSDVAAALANDATLSELFTATAGGDGTGLVDVNDTAVTSGGAGIEAGNEKTLADLIATINAVDPSRLQARFSADGDRLELVDLTTGAGTFSVSSHLGGTVAEDLGLTGTAADGVIASRRLLAGLKSTLISTFNGGRGFGQLGTVQLTDRSGATALVNFSSAETMEDVVEQINGAGVGIVARVNDARNGLMLLDTSGGTGNLVVASGDATGTAEKLKIAINAAQSRVNSGSWHRQMYSEHTLLSELNNGRGVQLGSFLITDSAGASRAINLKVSGAQTLGDVLDQLNGLPIGVDARINDTGDGIVIIDTAGGTGQLTIRDSGNGTAAKDLRIAGTSTVVDDNGTPSKRIDGRSIVKVDLTADDTLQTLVEKLNAAGAPVRASIIQDGSSSAPYRLSLVSQLPGSQGEMLVDSSLGIAMQEIVRAQDALLLVGAGTAGSGFLASSTNNEFKNVLPGVTLTLNGTSDKAVDVRVEANRDTVVTNVKLVVDEYNKLRDKLKSLTFFNENDKSTGLMFGSTEALRVDSDFARLFSSRFSTPGSIQSLESLGISLKDDGKLEFNETKLRDQLAANPDAVKQFFTDDTSGFVKKLNTVADQIAGVNNSILMNTTAKNQRTIESYNQRIGVFDLRLERRREALLREFYQMELAIGKLQNSMTALNALKPVPPLTS